MLSLIFYLGKTTTMSILTGLFPPTSGHAYLNGLSIKTQMPRIRQSLGICPQYNTLFDWLTVQEHLLFCGRVRGVPKKELIKSIDDLLLSLHLEDKRHVVAAKLSGGKISYTRPFSIARS